MREVSRSRKKVVLASAITLFIVSPFLFGACQSENDAPLEPEDGNVNPPFTSGFYDYWYELERLRVDIARRGRALLKERSARGDAVFGLTVVVPASYDITSVEVTTVDGVPVASWLIYARPISKQFAQNSGLSSPGWGGDSWAPIDIDVATAGLLVYWSDFSRETPVLDVPPIRDPTTIIGRYLELDLIEKTWLVVSGVRANH